MVSNSSIKGIDKIIEFIGIIRKDINSKSPGEIAANLYKLGKALSAVNPFNPNIYDIIAEAGIMEATDRLDDMRRKMLDMKLEFWKEKIGDSADLIDIEG